MDVIVDKIKNGEKHSLSITDVKSLHKFLVSKFRFNAKTYRLSNTLPEKSRFDRPVIYDMVSRKYTICSRGISQEEIIKELFIEALQHNDETLRAASYNHLSAAQSKIAKEIAENLYSDYIKQ